MLPSVTVLVPNYRHARYLPERLDSILAQTVVPNEVLLLDDCSPDDSLSILTAYAAERPTWRVVANEQNSGSPFAQWNKGVGLAAFDYVWIAESDDAADPLLLETLLQTAQTNPTAVLVYAQTVLMDEESRTLHSFQQNYDYLFGARAARWNEPYFARGIDELREYFILHNVVPNASGALIRKDAYLAAGGANPWYRLNGDWAFYTRLLEHGDIAYVPLPLNRFRVHAQTQRQAANASGAVYVELLTLADDLVARHSPPRAIQKKAYRNFAAWWAHSLYRQNWSGPNASENWRVNLQLLLRFARIHPLVLLHIPYEGAVRLAVFALECVHLKKPLRRLLHRWFPRVFFDPTP
jgi:glycosyltransferase involved in cell wall biosynthesis